MINAGNFDWHKKKTSYWEQFAKDKVKQLLKDEETIVSRKGTNVYRSLWSKIKNSKIFQY